jgi:hypothetical protein
MIPNPQESKVLISAHKALNIVARDAHRLADLVERFENRYAYLPDPVNEGKFYIPSSAETGRELDEDWKLYKNELWSDSSMVMIKAVFDLRAKIDDAFDVVREAGSVICRGSESLDKRWTTQTIGILRKLRGSIVRGHTPDLHPSCLPMIRSGVPASLRSASRSLLERIEAVKSVLIDGIPKPQNTVQPHSSGRDQVVLWHGAEPSARNIEIARSCTAVLEAHGNVDEAVKALERDGFKRSKSTVYNHMNARAKVDPKWQS